jgi:hypothetical protein
MKTTVIFAIFIFISVKLIGQNQDEEKNPREKVIQVTTVITEDPPTISFKWNPVPGHFNIEIFRKNKNASNWGNAIAILPANVVEYSDKNVETGIEYEYAIKAKWWMPIETYVTSGIKCKEIEYRGKIIFLVDSTFVSDLKNELKQYESDLIGDGWEVMRKDISREVSVKYVKSIILDFYNSDPKNVNSVFLFGHIPVPYSGNKAYDGHTGEHDGAWPADMYYGDLNEKLWTDKYVNCTTGDRIENRNIPGDGKFDVCELPKDEIISLAIGRVDFYNMPGFPQSETELLRNYLSKNHAFRHKIINPKMQSLVDDNWGIIRNQGVTEAFAISGWRNFSALFNFQNIKTGHFFCETENDSYIWSYGCGGGNFDSCKYVGSTTTFVNQSPKTVFTAFYGSRFGDWDSENNFMRAALASYGWILTSCWAGRPHYTFHQMGMGETIGYCVRATQNNVYNSNYFAGLTNRGIHTSLLGDPTLRMHIVRPVNSLKSVIMANKTVLLSWKPADDSIIGYYVYKLDKQTNKYIKLTNSPVAGNFFTDFSPVIGNNYYMVRTLILSKVASGSYYNLSQGVFDTIRYKQPILSQITRISRLYKSGEIPLIEPDNELQTEPELAHESVSITEIDEFIRETLIYPNPSTGRFNVSFGNSQVEKATLKIYNLHGKIIQIETFQNTDSGSFDISAFPKGIYIVKGIIDNKEMVTKICLQ